MTFWTSGDYKVTRQPGVLEAERKQRQDLYQTAGTDDLLLLNRLGTSTIPPSDTMERSLIIGRNDHPANDLDYGGPSILRMDTIV